MSSAIHNLQIAIVEGKQSITQLLRQTKLIAAKLDLEDVEKWVDLELGGYPPKTEIPQYREYLTHGLEYNNPYQGGWRFAGNLSMKLKARQPISQIENLLQGDFIAFPAPKKIPLTDYDGEASIASDFPQRITISPSQFRRILDGVTDKLLQWTTELEKRGIKGDNMNFDEQEKRTAGNMVFNITTVNGAVGNVSNSQVTFYDYKTINQLFAEKNIPKHDRRELEDILDELKDAQPIKKKSLVARAEELVLKHKEVLGAAAEIITKTIRAALD